MQHLHCLAILPWHLFNKTHIPFVDHIVKIIDRHTGINDPVACHFCVLVMRCGVTDLQRYLVQQIVAHEDVATRAPAADENLSSLTLLDGRERNVAKNLKTAYGRLVAPVRLDRRGVDSVKNIVGDLFDPDFVLSVDAWAVITIGANRSNAVDHATVHLGVDSGTPKPHTAIHVVDHQVDEFAVAAIKDI